MLKSLWGLLLVTRHSTVLYIFNYIEPQVSPRAPSTCFLEKSPVDVCSLPRLVLPNVAPVLSLDSSYGHANLRDVPRVRSLIDFILPGTTTPCTSPTQIKKRNNIMQEDRDIRDIRAGLILRENLVKEAEAKTRGQHDYRFVLQYFSASRNLHGTLVANVNYLANEVEQLRANMDHNSESISIMEQQFVELEVNHKTRVLRLAPRPRVPPILHDASGVPWLKSSYSLVPHKNSPVILSHAHAVPALTRTFRLPLPG